MLIKIEIDTGDAASINALYNVARAMMGISGDAPAPAKPASPPKAAAATPAPATPSTTSAPAAATTPAAAPATPTATPTADADLPAAQKAFQEFVKANGPAKAKAIIAEFGVASLAAMPAEQYGAFVHRLTQQ